MTRAKWAERLTPFTAGMGLALLVVAVVVQPAWALNPVCQACMSHWTSQAPKGECAGLSGYQQQACVSQVRSRECSKRKVDSNGQIYHDPCPGKQEPYYNDCGGEYCSSPTDPAGSSYCTAFCNMCNAAGNGCKNMEKVGIVGSTTYVYCGCGS